MITKTNLVVLITGAAGRLGQAFAKCVIESGSCVFLVDINEEKINKICKSIGRKYSSYYSADISSDSGINEAIFTCIKYFGKVDAVVHSAYPRSVQWGVDFEQLESQYLFEDLNKQLGGAILLSQHVIKQFKSKKADI